MSEFSTTFLIKQNCSGLSITNVIPTPIENGFLVEVKDTDIEDSVYAILNYCYEEHGWFHGQYCKVCSADLWGFVNLELKEVVHPRYQEVEDVNEGISIIKEYGKYSYMYPGTGQPHRPIVYDKVWEFRNKMGRVFKDGLYGFVSYSTNSYADDIPCRFLDAGDFSAFDGLLAPVQTEEGWRFIDRKKKFLTTIIFTEKPIEINHEACAVCVSGKWGVMDCYGKYFIDPIFDDFQWEYKIKGGKEFYAYIEEIKHNIDTDDWSYNEVENE